jgi:methionine-S-sulfoxide reductase
VYLAGVSNDDPDFENMRQTLYGRGVGVVDLMSDQTDVSKAFIYKYQKATGMMCFVSAPEEEVVKDVPRFIPVMEDMETVLITNGWSFLDPDENEPMSAFDVDAANSEGQYKPKWGQQDGSNESGLSMSQIGFDLNLLTDEEVKDLAVSIVHKDMTRASLLEGGTDPPNLKCTHNNFDFKGPAGQSDIPKGVFSCAIGGLPLFSSFDLAPTTASSGWLSFSESISPDHILLIQPEQDATDRRVEVLCAKSRCHLGHYFGPREGYCINASCLNFVEVGSTSIAESLLQSPRSWRKLDDVATRTQRQLRDVLLSGIQTETIVLGAGCFWHVEAATRRLPGVVDTTVGFAGGIKQNPSYEEVCHQDTRHAEVVKVEYDPRVLSTRVLIESFLAIHDPTKVRAHGKHASGTGQYRSCIFAMNAETSNVASFVLKECEEQLQKQLSTQLHIVEQNMSWFWRAADRHQRHEERRPGHEPDVAPLSFGEWMGVYGQRATSVVGSAETMNYYSADS